MLTTAQAIAEFLKASGTSHFFQVTGGDQGLWFALQDAGIRMIGCRTEQGATYMADGFARVTNGPAWVYGQHGPGAANIAAALADAGWAESSVIALTSSVPVRQRDQFAYQELRQTDVFAPFTTWTGEIVHPDDVARVLRLALRSSIVAHRPAHVDVPRDIFDLAATDAVPPVESWLAGVTALRSAEPDAAAVAEATKILADAERVIVLVGGEVLTHHAYDELQSLCETLAAPVVSSLPGKGAVADASPTYCGVVGRYGTPVANRALGEAAVVLAVGTPLDKLTTDNHGLLADDVQVVQVTSDVAALGCAYGPVSPVYGDLRRSLQLLASALTADEDEPRLAARRAWAVALAEENRAWRARLTRAFSDVAPIHPVAVMDALAAGLTGADIVVADTGYMAAWAGALLPVHRPGRNFLRAAGSLGWAVPGAMGVSLARPDAKVVAITGDGGFAYNCLEIETAVRHGLSTVIVVLNNQALAFEYHLQRHQFGRHLPQTTDFSDIDLAALAIALGGDGRRVDHPDQLAPAVETALSSDGVFVLDVRIDKEAIPPVTTYGHPADGLLPVVTPVA